ncbi:hypothetical protein PPYR_14734 [Photinus pyralis]|uniref:Uncharacterized protein n=1 Tax=Photinus pyralis TaxID=7054 RepID=A0A5N4A633_PHOPY|nr:hypothetical protein PPYR_14734 [Photinus pyralis]
MIERVIQTVKGLLTKAFEEGTDPFLAVLNYNITSKQDFPSPSIVLMGRRLRSTLPVAKSILNPKYSAKMVKQTLKCKQHKQKLCPIDKMMQQGMRDWKPATVIKESGPNDYLVNLNDAVYRRNRRFLKPLNINQKLDHKNTVETQDSFEQDTQSSTSNYLPFNDSFVTKEDDSDEYVGKGNDQNGNTRESRLLTRCGRVVRPPKKFDT